MCKRRVLITGASRGIGKAIALASSTAGYEVAVHYNRNKDMALEVVEKIRESGGIADAISFDISDRESVKTSLEADIEKNGVYYGVVCNAGIADDNPFPLLTGEQWDSVIQTNLNGFYNVLSPLVMPMVSSRKSGRIISISSISGVVGNRGQVNYSAAKAGIIGATKALAVELAKHKITVNCIAPGVIETDMTNELPLDEVKKTIPMRRIGNADEVASLAVYLLSEGASYITRQVIGVNGGLF